MTDEKLPTIPQSPISRDVVKEIAMDIGKEVVAHIETMYPEAIKATSSTFRLSVRNTVYNEIMAALETIDEDAIRARIEARKKWRRRNKAAWKRIRGIKELEDKVEDSD